MGIPRLTQDLQPYLEDAILSGGATGSIQALVIDGPSMVYHIYNRLQSHNLAQGDASRIHDVTTYSLLNLATQQFLLDIEARGVKIFKILFDGALPKSKKQTRADRLEKSRRALELYRAAYPNFDLRQSDLSREVSQALWKSQSRMVSTDIAAPFIVPSVLECLRSSKWSDIISVVPGEADSFCAYEARQNCAAVLTNDSDLVLFDGVETVVVLNSLDLNEDGQIQAKCWRPQWIAERFGVPSLCYFGFVRASNPKASFNIVAQTAREAIRDNKFEDFEAEFKLKPGMLGLDMLNNLDPRFAELLCQILESDPVRRAEISLPLLLEDLNRDASWSYGKDVRRLAYSILVKRFTPLRLTEIVEFSRKGPAITATTFVTLPEADFGACAQKLLDRLSQYPLDGPCSWFAYALHEVWSQRNNAGRSVFSAQVLSILLGLAPLPIVGQRTINMWDVMHLNANIQAVLYSARLLTQATDLDSTSKRFENIDALIVTLQRMPAMEQIFLTPYETRRIFENLSRKELKGLLQPFLIEFSMSGTLGINDACETSARPATQRLVPGKSQQGEFVVTKRKRRKRENNVAQNFDTPSQRSRNTFDVLSGSVQ